MAFKRRNLIELVVLTVGVVVFGLAVSHAVYVSHNSSDKLEASLQEQAEAALAGDLFTWASVRLEGRRAVVTGTAPTEDFKAQALDAVKSIPGGDGWLGGGIRSVRDQVSVQPPADPYEFAAFKTTDIITLNGMVPNPEAAEDVSAVLTELGFGEEDVRLQLSYRDGVPDGDWAQAIVLGLSELARLDDGEFRLSGKNLYLSGQAPNNDVKLEILSRMTRPPAGYATSVDLLGTAVWSATLTRSELRLSGDVPSNAARQELIRIAKSVYKQPVVDQMQVSEMADSDWVEAIKVALPGFVRYQNGVMVYLEDRVTINGQATASAADYLREDLVQAGTYVDIVPHADIVPLRLEAFETAPDTGELPTRQVCTAALDEALDLGPINFEYARDELSRESGPALDGVLAVMTACPHLIFYVDAAMYAGGKRIALEKLTHDRQTAVVSYFIAHGVPLDQIEMTEVRTDTSGLGRVRDVDPDRQISVRLRESSDG